MNFDSLFAKLKNLEARLSAHPAGKAVLEITYDRPRSDSPLTRATWLLINATEFITGKSVTETDDTGRVVASSFDKAVLNCRSALAGSGITFSNERGEHGVFQEMFAALEVVTARITGTATPAAPAAKPEWKPSATEVSKLAAKLTPVGVGTTGKPATVASTPTASKPEPTPDQIYAKMQKMLADERDPETKAKLAKACREYREEHYLFADRHTPKKKQ